MRRALQSAQTRRTTVFVRLGESGRFQSKRSTSPRSYAENQTLIGAVGTPTPRSLAENLESAGFKVLRTSNASINGLQSPLIERADGYFKTVRFAIRGLVRVGVLPAHFNTIFDRFAQDGDAFIEADKARLITTSYHWLAEKPRNAENKSSGRGWQSTSGSERDSSARSSSDSVQGS